MLTSLKTSFLLIKFPVGLFLCFLIAFLHPVLPQIQTKLDDLALGIAKQLDVVDVGGGASEALNLFTASAGNAPAAFTPAANFTAGFAGTIQVRAAL